MVVVLYQVTVTDSLTVQSLQQILASNPFPELRKVTIVDNSSVEDTPVFTDERFTYHYAHGNQGLAKAYNFVWPQSLTAGCKWLVTLDQDTNLTVDYFKEMIASIMDADETMAIIAPVIQDNDQQVSPVRSDTLRPLHTSLPKGGETYSERIMVINSAAAISLDFLEKIGGYNELFSLDYLDHWLCWRVYQENYKINILHTEIQHQLSVLDYKTLTKKRYKKIIEAEMFFYSKYQNNLFRMYRRQLWFRCFKQLATFKFNFSKITWQQIREKRME
ncbi:glycosyltransferase family 2 protein [Enterococcus sp. AZ109]|uniref:glycosyltransferase family 2 protein n=1 Tax=Enterococcus sp. AZ109 TaxID=2774634 RepID=UPI003F68453A